jgi:hypothetical protein
MVEELATDNAETQRSSWSSIGVALSLARARPPKFRLLSGALRQAMSNADVGAGVIQTASSCCSWRSDCNHKPLPLIGSVAAQAP